MPEFSAQYITLVEANSGEVLFNRQVMQYLKAQMNVYRVDGGHDREMGKAPHRTDIYPLGVPSPPPLPNTFPDDWCNNNRSTFGNSTRAHLAGSSVPLRGTANGDLVFDPSDAVGDDQKVLNIFYYCCYMHDFFYLLGFREINANFQADNLGRGGLASDPVDARAHHGSVQGTASMGHAVDGRSPIMNMGLVTRTNRHTAFALDVVSHEYTHGVINRLVGGGNIFDPLSSDHGGCMHEGTADLISCTITNKTVTGNWVVDDPRGIRNNRYDSNFPHNFGHLGTQVNVGNRTIDYSEVHNGGEIWCATLMEMNRNIGSKLGVQLVVDALKIVQTSPSFLNMRDAIVAALDSKLKAESPMDPSEHKKARNGIWKAFAKFGMGPAAQSNGGSFSGIRADFNVPS